MATRFFGIFSKKSGEQEGRDRPWWEKKKYFEFSRTRSSPRRAKKAETAMFGKPLWQNRSSDFDEIWTIILSKKSPFKRTRVSRSERPRSAGPNFGLWGSGKAPSLIPDSEKKGAMGRQGPPLIRKKYKQWIQSHRRAPQTRQEGQNSHIGRVAVAKPVNQFHWNLHHSLEKEDNFPTKTRFPVPTTLFGHSGHRTLRRSHGTYANTIFANMAPIASWHLPL